MTYRRLGGLGIDAPDPRYPGEWVTTLSSLRGPAGWNADGAPGVFVARLREQGFSLASAAWKEGGQLWVRYGVEGRQPEWIADQAARRARVRTAIAVGAMSLGIHVRLADGTALPAPVGPPSPTPPSGTPPRPADEVPPDEAVPPVISHTYPSSTATRDVLIVGAVAGATVLAGVLGYLAYRAGRKHGTRLGRNRHRVAA